jgi:hypothetical protein
MEHQELQGKRPTVELHETAEVQREVATGVLAPHYDCFVKIGQFLEFSLQKYLLEHSLIMTITAVRNCIY